MRSWSSVWAGGEEVAVLSVMVAVVRVAVWLVGGVLSRSSEGVSWVSSLGSSGGAVVAGPALMSACRAMRRASVRSTVSGRSLLPRLRRAQFAATSKGCFQSGVGRVSSATISDSMTSA